MQIHLPRYINVSRCHAKEEVHIVKYICLYFIKTINTITKSNNANTWQNILPCFKQSPKVIFSEQTIFGKTFKDMSQSAMFVCFHPLFMLLTVSTGTTGTYTLDIVDMMWDCSPKRGFDTKTASLTTVYIFHIKTQISNDFYFRPPTLLLCDRHRREKIHICICRQRSVSQMPLSR